MQKCGFGTKIIAQAGCAVQQFGHKKEERSLPGANMIGIATDSRGTTALRPEVMAVAARRKVLVVDDSPLVRLRVKNALAGLDVDVLEMRRAEDLLAAPELVAGVDLIILDLYLPGMDGLTALRRLREEHGLSRVPVMVLTVSADPGDVRRAVELGAVDYLLKPFTDEALLTRLEKIVGPLARPRPSPRLRTPAPRGTETRPPSGWPGMWSYRASTSGCADSSRRSGPGPRSAKRRRRPSGV